MPKEIEIHLEKRGVSCRAELLEDLAPRTCDAIWRSLPQGGDAFHAKYASNEVYTLVPPFPEVKIGVENPTLTPIPGDILYFFFPPGTIANPDVRDFAREVGVVDLAVFYGRDNLLFSPTMGPVPGNRFAAITENFEEMAEACADVWRAGFAGERLAFRRT